MGATGVLPCPRHDDARGSFGGSGLDSLDADPIAPPPVDGPARARARRVWPDRAESAAPDRAAERLTRRLGLGRPSAAPGAGQTDTEWGRIWDDVPPGFPRFPGSTVADDAAPEPASLRLAVPDGDPQAIAAWMQAALETATYSTEGLSGPFEDGSLVLDSVGDGDCRIETVVAPLGGMTFVTVRYGAACPAP